MSAITRLCRSQPQDEQHLHAGRLHRGIAHRHLQAAALHPLRRYQIQHRRPLRLPLAIHRRSARLWPPHPPVVSFYATDAYAWKAGFEIQYNPRDFFKAHLAWEHNEWHQQGSKARIRSSQPRNEWKAGVTVVPIRPLDISADLYFADGLGYRNLTEGMVDYPRREISPTSLPSTSAPYTDSTSTYTSRPSSTTCSPNAPTSSTECRHNASIFS